MPQGQIWPIAAPEDAMKEEPVGANARLLPIAVTITGILIWAAASALRVFPESAFPSPMSVAGGFVEEIKTGRLFNDLVASLFRVTVGFVLAAVSGIPLGLVLGQQVSSRVALMPAINFFRNLSPLAWIPFAILWFGIGDVPAIFLIFMASFFPIVLATVAAVATIPAVYFRVARDYGIRGSELFTKVTLPAILPQIITALRVTAGLAWVVVVAAEMIAGRDGLGFAIWDARNGLRMDLLVAGMVVIGVIGVVIDKILVQLTRIPSVRWGYER
jgi:NitT/TauT family transport system permease protein